MFKNERGITLVALVVTVVVLLILAGITLTLVLGQNGIILKTNAAKTNYTNAQVKENEELTNAETYMNNL